MTARVRTQCHNVTAMDLDPDLTVCRHNDGRVSIGIDVEGLTIWFYSLTDMDLFAAELVRLVAVAEAKVSTLLAVAAPTSDTPHGA